MDEKTFTSTQIVKVLDKNRRRLTWERESGYLTEDQERKTAEMIAGLAAEFGLFSEYAFYQPQPDAGNKV
ncbi:MAG: hypothetical protein NT147_03070 [Candidatus Aminicenantes bacterium]|nr:hypothetical protein [Candidatus Aminicenantes bacterium]